MHLHIMLGITQGTDGLRLRAQLNLQQILITVWICQNGAQCGQTLLNKYMKFTSLIFLVITTALKVNGNDQQTKTVNLNKWHEMTGQQAEGLEPHIQFIKDETGWSFAI